MTTAAIIPGTVAGFGDRFYATMRAYRPVCVGIDPYVDLLRERGLDDDASGMREFSFCVIEALGGCAAAFKPRAAFFERHGSRGVIVLEEVIAACHEVGTLCTADAKCGDIGSTMDGYAQAFLSDSSPLAGDAVTLSPYLGVGPPTPALELARQTRRGVFVLALTSNPEGAPVQHARGKDGTNVAGRVVSQLTDFNGQRDQQHLGPVGTVVGATVGDTVKRLDIDPPSLNGAFLAPGLGVQGVGPVQVREVFAGAEDAVPALSSRVTLRTGPSTAGLQDVYRMTVDSLQQSALLLKKQHFDLALVAWKVT